MNAKQITFAALTAAITLLAVAEVSQAAEKTAIKGHHGHYAGYYPGFYGGYGWHASTVAESYMRGRADVIRAQGEYNLDTSEAWINAEEARRRYFDNKIRYAETYFELRRTNESYMAGNRRNRLTPEQISEINQRRTPERMTAVSLDPVEGDIKWPVALQGADFAAQREHLEELFAKRAPDNSGAGSENFTQVKQATNAMLKTLKSKVRDMEPSQYVAARKFVDSLSYEARQPKQLEAFANVD